MRRLFVAILVVAWAAWTSVALAGGESATFLPPGADAGGYGSLAAAQPSSGRSTSPSREAEYAEIVQIMVAAESVQTSPAVQRSMDAWADAKSRYGERDPRALDAQSRALSDVVAAQTDALRMYDQVIDRLETMVYQDGDQGSPVADDLLDEYQAQLEDLQVEARWRATECYLEPKSCRPMSSTDEALLDEVQRLVAMLHGEADPRFDPEGMLRTSRLLRLRSQTAIQVAKVAGVSIILDWVSKARPDGRIPPVVIPIDRKPPPRPAAHGSPVGDPYSD